MYVCMHIYICIYIGEGGEGEEGGLRESECASEEEREGGGGCHALGGMGRDIRKLTRISLRGCVGYA
jgi:hypothetical protein